MTVEAVLQRIETCVAHNCDEGHVDMKEVAALIACARALAQSAECQDPNNCNCDKRRADALAALAELE